MVCSTKSITCHWGRLTIVRTIVKIVCCIYLAIYNAQNVTDECTVFCYVTGIGKKQQ